MHPNPKNYSIRTIMRVLMSHTSPSATTCGATLPGAITPAHPRSKGQDRRGQILDMLKIHMRPPEIKTASFPAIGRAT